MGIDDLVRMLNAATEQKRRPRSESASAPEAELCRVLRDAAGGLDAVPPGWGRLLRETERMLASAAVTLASRSAITVTGLYILASKPHVRLSAEDAVVHGIYRRALTRARHTCQVCGRAGRTWNDLSQFKVLCPRCAAPHVIAADLDRVQELRDRQRGAGRNQVIADLPVRLAQTLAERLAAESDWRTSDGHRPTSTARPVTTEEFDRWCEWLLALRKNPMFAQAFASVR